MGLKTVLDNVEGVDDAVKTFYKPGEGGKYILDVDDYDAHPSVRNLKSAFEAQKTANGELRNERDSLKAKVSELPEDFDAARWIELKAGAEKTKGQKDAEITNLTQLHEARIRALTSEHEKTLRERDEALERERVMGDQTSRETELTNVLVKYHVKEDLLDGAKLLIGQKIKTVRSEDGTRQNVVPTNLGDLPLGDYVKNWVEGDGKPYIAPPSGPDARGGRPNGQIERNPWAKDSLNLTEQGRILREDRDRAQRLMKEAGVNSHTIAARFSA